MESMSIQTKLDQGLHSVTIFKEPPKVDCPFCLYKTELTHFYIRLKDKPNGEPRWSDKTAVCPDCGVKMRLSTLLETTKMKPVEYGKWVADQMSWSSGRERVNFPKLKHRLWLLGITSTFWTAYRSQKEKNDVARFGSSRVQQWNYIEEKWKEYSGG